jgi:hypothetical protein
MLTLRSQISEIVHDYGDVTRFELGNLLRIHGFTDYSKINETLWYMAADGIITFDSNWHIAKGDNVPAD